MLPLFNINFFYDYQFTDKWGIQGDLSLETGTEPYNDGTAAGFFTIISVAPKYYIQDDRISRRGHLKQLYVSTALFGQLDTGKRLDGGSVLNYDLHKVAPFQIYISPQITYRHIGKKGFIYQFLLGYPIGVHTPDHSPYDYDLYQKESFELKFSLGYMIF
ncbi:hypothetical protein [Flammeovirga aprica]|uniref:Outer membrane protein beta-barrel domain-containing protein n=1 Tax=Flammeovirga aprica JL-4 TaxID=694437 RepID=A0A7X9P187_9BACT|nr:hypothetical protein [Flammeovirga aprica]NME66492.1 hypothetical protein [Flammeovirga aprica JL-4]